MQLQIRLTCVVIVVICFTYSNCSAQQKVQFTQYMFNGLVLNPAMAGTDNAPSFTFVNRSQWQGVEGAPKTQTLSGQTYYKKKQVGVGLSLVNDVIGVHKNQNIFGSMSYRLPIYYNKAYLSVGLHAGVDIHQSDYASLLTGNTIDPGLLNSRVSYAAFNVGMGIYFKTPIMELGLSAPQLVPERYTYSDSVKINWNNAQYFGFIRYTIRMNKSVDFQPSILVKYLQGVPVSYDINIAFVFKKVLTPALSYRKNESIGFLLKAKLTPKLSFGYSYDYAIGKVSRNGGGSNEIMVNYLIKKQRRKFASPR